LKTHISATALEIEALKSQVTHVDHEKQALIEQLEAVTLSHDKLLVSVQQQQHLPEIEDFDTDSGKGLRSSSFIVTEEFFAGGNGGEQLGNVGAGNVGRGSKRFSLMNIVPSIWK
ncbi:hypothetical protein HK100_000280, partial [Physocladia obscura]